jgi:biofilm PGA synthesis N-glycosyltransferase PgaC
MTWRLMENFDCVLFEPSAVTFTDGPENVRYFIGQRTLGARRVSPKLRGL